MLRKNLRSPPFILRFFSGIAFTLLLFSGGETTVSAQNSLVATATPNRETLTVGDPIEVDILVQHPRGYSATLTVEDWGNFELLTQPKTMQTPSGSKLEISVTLWAPGSYELSSLPVRIHDNGGESETIITNRLPFTVTSVLSADDRELRDIRPQATMSQLQLPWAWLLLIGGLVAGGTAVWRHKHKPKESIPIPTAQSEAAAALDKLPKPESGKWIEVATAVLHILRRFLQQTTAIPIHYRTTAELSGALP